MSTVLKCTVEALEDMGLRCLDQQYVFAAPTSDVRTRRMMIRVVRIDHTEPGKNKTELEGLESIGKPLCMAVCEHTDVELEVLIASIDNAPNLSLQLSLVCAAAADRGAHRRRRPA